MNLRPSGYEPDELPDCSTPQQRARILRALRTLYKAAAQIVSADTRLKAALAHTTR